jgi:hypothetical protein
MTKAWQEGWKAAGNGGSNPYRSDDDRALDWFDGWSAARGRSNVRKAPRRGLWTRENRFG